MSTNYLETVLELLDPPPSPADQTKRFKGIPHDEILYAYKNWLEYLKLLIKEPISFEVIQGRQDEGVDLVITFHISNKKLGIQVKSNNELVDDKFRQKIMAQIAYSKKHGLSKLLIAPCADLDSRSQDHKIRNLMSQVSQMSDNYVVVIAPQKILPVVLSFKNRKHPLAYLGQSKRVIELIQGLSAALSTEEYTATIILRYDYKINDGIDRPFKASIVFRPFDKDKDDNPVDKMARLQNLKENVEFSKGEIEEVIITHPDGRVERIKPEFLRGKPEMESIGPYNMFSKTGTEPVLTNIILNKEASSDKFVTYKSSDDLLPWVFEFSILSNGKSVVRLQLKFDAADFQSFDAYGKFIEEIRKQGTFILEDVTTKVRAEVPVGNGVTLPLTAADTSLIANLAFIQRKLGKRIPVSSDPAAYNIQLIEEIAKFMKEGKIEKSAQPYPADVKKDDVLACINELKAKQRLEGFDIIISQMGVKLVGQDLLMGPIKIVMKNVLMEGDLAEIEGKANSLKDNEILKCIFKSDGTVKDIYEFLPQDNSTPETEGPKTA